MRDIPFFTTEYGIAGIVLREIPYQGDAYVHIHTATQLQGLIEECIAFCRAAGAERIYARGDAGLEKYPVFTRILKMQCLCSQMPQTDACVYPVVQQTVSQWLQIYREKIRGVPSAAWMTNADARALLAAGNAYFVHRDGKLLGIGIVSGNELQWVASVEKGAGKDVVSALCHCITQEEVWLTVSADNHKAMQLYEKLGFVVTQELAKWHKIF